MKMESEDSVMSTSSNSSVIDNEYITEEIKKEDAKLKKKVKLDKQREDKIKNEEYLRQARKEQAVKAMKFLLNTSSLYSNYITKRFVDKENVPKGRSTQEKLSNTNRKRKINESLDLNLDENTELDTQVQEKKILQPKLFEGGMLRDYQLDGLNWMKQLYKNGLHGILADEMGLGKTIQIIALICNLIEENINGPYLIVAPLSTIPNWLSEFKKFAPKIPVILYHGNEFQRQNIQRDVRKKYKINNTVIAPVILTTYQIPITDTHFFNSYVWKYIIIDEGHRIKNHKSKLSIELCKLQSLNRLILTGTPLQNNLTELWALLHFLIPHIFNDNSMFASLIFNEDLENGYEVLKEEEKSKAITTLHKVLAPFMLRRLKSEVLDDIVPKKETIVYCNMTPEQLTLYKYVLDKNIELILKKDDTIDINSPRGKRLSARQQKYDVDKLSFDDYMKFLEEEQVSTTPEVVQNSPFLTRLTMASPHVMLQKIVNHPYLVKAPLDTACTEFKQILIDEELIEKSGKMMVLDALLARLKAGKHKVLLFCTSVMMLDYIEDYFEWRNYKCARLDGSSKLEKREQEIKYFSEDPDVLAFLISTRAGGLGLNLVAADTVIFYDSDWNPQADSSSR